MEYIWKGMAHYNSSGIWFTCVEMWKILMHVIFDENDVTSDDRMTKISSRMADFDERLW